MLCIFFVKKTIVAVVIGDLYNDLNFLDPSEHAYIKYVSVCKTRRPWATSLT